MRGYQAIPSAAADGIEGGVPSGDRGVSPGAPSANRADARAAPSWTSKLGCISLGMMAGCLLAGGLATRGPGADKDRARASTAARHQFSDALPFEEVNPLTWVSARKAGGTPKAKTPSLLASPWDAAASPPPAAPHLLYHAHEAAFLLLYDAAARSSSGSRLSEYSLDYFLLNTGGFDAQINQAYCAVATVAAVLNSLRYTKRFQEKEEDLTWSFTFHLPVDPVYAPYPYATQTDILASDCVRATVIEHGDGDEHATGLLAPPYGLTLEQSAKLLACHTSDGWVVRAQEVDGRLGLSNVRFDLKAALIDPDARVLVNYDRKGLGQQGGGHFSPLGAYDAATDSFLILDVAKYKYPPVWVGAATLFAAMGTADACGTWDYPEGQARIRGTPRTPEDYRTALELLNCKQKMRGYITLRKKR